MDEIIKKLQEKYNFFEIKETVLKGHSTRITLKNYVFETQEKENIEPLRIEINQCHAGNQPIDMFKVSIVNCETDDEAQDLFWTNDYNKINNLISAILE